MAKKYLIKHWINTDVTAEKIVEADDLSSSDVEKLYYPDGTFSYNMVIGSEKIIRTTYEEYDEKFNDSSKEPTSDKWY